MQHASSQSSHEESEHHQIGGSPLLLPLYVHIYIFSDYCTPQIFKNYAGVGVGLQGSGVTVVTVRGSRGRGDVCTSTVYIVYIS